MLLKAAIQFIILIWYLCFKIPRPDVFIVQVSYHKIALSFFICSFACMVQNYMDNMYFSTITITFSSVEFFYDSSFINHCSKTMVLAKYFPA